MKLFKERRQACPKCESPKLTTRYGPATDTLHRLCLGCDYRWVEPTSEQLASGTLTSAAQGQGCTCWGGEPKTCPLPYHHPFNLAGEAPAPSTREKRARLCPGCRDRDEAHDFGRGCYLECDQCERPFTEHGPGPACPAPASAPRPEPECAHDWVPGDDGMAFCMNCHETAVPRIPNATQTRLAALERVRDAALEWRRTFEQLWRDRPPGLSQDAHEASQKALMAALAALTTEGADD